MIIERIKAHPWLSAAAGIAILLVLYFLFFRGGSTSAQPVLTQQPGDNSLAIATMAQQLGMQQTNNALTIAQAQVQGAKDVSLAQIAANSGVSQMQLADALQAHISDNTTTLQHDTITTQATTAQASLASSTATSLANISSSRDTSLANINANRDISLANIATTNSTTLATIAQQTNQQNNDNKIQLANINSSDAWQAQMSALTAIDMKTTAADMRTNDLNYTLANIYAHSGNGNGSALAQMAILGLHQ